MLDFHMQNQTLHFWTRYLTINIDELFPPTMYAQQVLCFLS